MTPLGSFTCPTEPDVHAAPCAPSPPARGITPVLSIITAALEEEPDVAGDAALRQPPHHDGHVPRGARRPEEPLPGAVPARARALRGSRRTSSFSPAASTPSGVSRILDAARPGRHGRRVVPVRPVTAWSTGARGAAGGARASTAPRPPRDLPRRRAGVPAAGRSCIDAGAPPEAVVTVNLDGRTTRIEMPSREETILDATLRVAARRALLVHGRRLRHVPRPARLRAGADGPQLRARARRGGGRDRPRLPEPPGHRRGRPRLRRLTAAPPTPVLLAISVEWRIFWLGHGRDTGNKRRVERSLPLSVLAGPVDDRPWAPRGSASLIRCRPGSPPTALLIPPRRFVAPRRSPRA